MPRMSDDMAQLNLILPRATLDAARQVYAAKGTTVLERVRRMLERDGGVRVPRRKRGEKINLTKSENT